MKIDRSFIAIFALFSMLVGVTAVSAQNNTKLPKLKYEEFTLKNGLRVVLHEDHSTPIVAVNVWYHVGSKNEVPGKTGFAHLFEHMMFQGSKNYNTDYFGPLQEAGANINGSTNSDRTNYYEVVPSNFLELALFMEADRMGGLLPAMTLDKLDNQRKVVKNERRQNTENVPYGTSFEKMSSLMFPPDHPYHWTTIGSLEDVSNASMEDVQAFFKKYYAPNNASLVIAGDIDPKQAKQFVTKYFGGIPAGGKIDRPNPNPPKFNGELRKQFEDAVPFERRSIVWHTAPANSPDDAALSILGAILSNGRGSRLQSKLMYDQQLVQSVFAGNSSREIAGSFSVTMTERPNQALDPIEKMIDAEIEKIKNNPPSQEEVARAKNAYESRFVFGLQTVLGKADQLNSNLVFRNNPDSFQEQLNAFRGVTPEDITRVARKYLGSDRLVMSIVPAKKKEAPVKRAGNAAAQAGSEEANSGEAKKLTNNDQAKNLPKPGAVPKFTLPKIQKTKLSNGLNVWIVPQGELPIVSFNMVVNTGGTANPNGKEGLADITASMLNQGTDSRSALEISNTLQDLGTGIRAFSDWDSTAVSIDALSRDVDGALNLYSDIILNPSFPDKELDLYKRRATLGFRQRNENPAAIATNVYGKVLYGAEHPYGRPLNGDEKSVASISKSDLQSFHDKYFVPNNATLIVVGNVDQATILPKLEKAFGSWKAMDAPATEVPPVVKASKPGLYLVDKPGAAQSELRIGEIGVDKKNPDIIPILVMNQILGGQFSARVNMNLREDKGYTYGARTGFAGRRGAGPFTASAGVQTLVTKEAVMEFMKELNGIKGSIPITQAELDYAKQSLIRGFPRTVETNGQIAGQLSDIAVYDLPETYLNDYLAKIGKVTLADVNRVANQYLSPDKMSILVVGDRAEIEKGLRSIPVWGEMLQILDVNGNPVASN